MKNKIILAIVGLAVVGLCTVFFLSSKVQGTSSYTPVTEEATAAIVTATQFVSAGQTRKLVFYPEDIVLDDTAPPTKNTTEGGTGNTFEVLQFPGITATGGDSIVHIKWHVPDGYVVDSARLNVIWSCESAETALDTATFDLSILSIAAGEAVDAAMTGFTAVNDITWAGTADILMTTQLNFEVLTIAVDDMVYITFWVDASTGGFTDTIDIHALEIEWESSE